EPPTLSARSGRPAERRRSRCRDAVPHGVRLNPRGCGHFLGRSVRSANIVALVPLAYRGVTPMTERSELAALQEALAAAVEQAAGAAELARLLTDYQRRLDE